MVSLQDMPRAVDVQEQDVIDHEKDALYVAHSTGGGRLLTHFYPDRADCSLHIGFNYKKQSQNAAVRHVPTSFAGHPHQSSVIMQFSRAECAMHVKKMRSLLKGNER